MTSRVADLCVNQSLSMKSCNGIWNILEGCFCYFLLMVNIRLDASSLVSTAGLSEIEP